MGERAIMDMEKYAVRYMYMKAYSRFIGVLLTVCLLIGSLPVPALAEYIEAIQLDTFTEEQIPAEESVPEEIPEEESQEIVLEEVTELEDVTEEPAIPGNDSMAEDVPAEDEIVEAPAEVPEDADVEILEIIDEEIETTEDEAASEEEAESDVEEGALGGGAGGAEDSFAEIGDDEIIQSVMIDSYLAFPNTMDPVYFNGEDIEVEYASNIVEVSGFEDDSAYSFEGNVLTLHAEGIAAMPDGNHYLHLLLEDDSNCIQPIIKGAVIMGRGMMSPNYKVTAPPEGGMTIRMQVYSAADLAIDQYGEDWYWNADAQELILQYWENRSISSGERYILIDRPASIRLLGVNDYALIYSSKGLTVGGSGRLNNSVFYNEGSGNLDFKNCVGIEAEITNSTGGINFENVRTFDDTEIWAKKGSITITDSDIMAEYVDAGKNLTIKGSVVFTTNVYTDGTNDIYAEKKLKVTDSVCIYNYMRGKGGSSIASSVALFQYDYWEWIKGTLYSYDDCYALRKSATLGKNFNLPYLNYHADSYAIAKGKKLTIKSGKTVTMNDECFKDGKVSGNLVYKSAYSAENYEVIGPERVTAGTAFDVTIRVWPEDASFDFYWEVDRPELVSIDYKGNLRLTEESKNHVGETVMLTVCPTVGGMSNEYDGAVLFTIGPCAESIEVKRENEDVQEVELWLDPVNNTVQLDAVVNPWDAQQDVTWVSSSTKVARVDETGLVTAKAAGTAYVHAEANDESGVVSPQVKVVVKKAPSSVKINPATVVLAYDEELGLGTSCQLSTVLSKGSASSITFTSGNEDIVAVDEDGVVTATGVGKAKVTARTFNKKSGSRSITVKPAPEEVSLNTRNLEIGRLDSYAFSASIPKGTHSDLTYSVNSDIASIDPVTGEFYAKEVGSCEVCVTTFNGKTDICTVDIVPEPEQILLNKTSIELGKGEKFSLLATPALSSGAATKATLTYSTDNKKVAIVSDDGQITAKGAGTACITVTSHNGVPACCDVLVTKAPSSVKLNKKSLTMAYDAALNLGTEFQLAATLSKGSVSALTWKSSNEAVIKVNDNGYLTAVGTGKAKVTVRTFNKKSATCSITVKPAPIQLDMVTSADVISVGQTAELTTTFSKGSAGTYSYSCDPEGIVALQGNTVVPTGNVLGTVVITATAFNGVNDSCAIEVKAAPDSVVLEPASIELGKGEKYQLNPLINNGSPADFTYSVTSGTKKAKVDETGKITAKSAGDAVITVKPHLGEAAVFAVKVLNAPGKVQLSASKVNMKAGEKMKLIATLPDNTASKIRWSSSNKNAVVVDASGNVTAVGRGTATITAKTFNGKTAKCTIKVSWPDAGESFAGVELSSYINTSLKGAKSVFQGSYEAYDYDYFKSYRNDDLWIAALKNESIISFISVKQPSPYVINGIYVGCELNSAVAKLESAGWHCDNMTGGEYEFKNNSSRDIIVIKNDGAQVTMVSYETPHWYEWQDYID